MKNRKKMSVGGMVTAVLPLMLALTVVSACDTPQPIEELPEKLVPCYTTSGEFAKWDDDCHDDGLVVGSPPSSLKPLRPYGGTKTTAPAKPKPSTVKASPRR